MTYSGRGIGRVLTLAAAVSTSHGCGQVSLGSTTSVDGGGADVQPHYCGITTGVARVNCGDVNRDWVIDSRDALLVAQYVEEMGVTVWLDACDVDCDGQITIADANMINSYAAGIISAFPCAAKQP
jgi:hypothetical protein